MTVKKNKSLVKNNYVERLPSTELVQQELSSAKSIPDLRKAS